MLGYIGHRLMLLIPVLIGISAVVFILMSVLPGDPALAILGPYATPDSLAKLRAELGLDRPLVWRFFYWLGNIVQGDLGRSISLHRPVADEVVERLGATVLLTSVSLLLSSLLGLGVGMLTAARHNRWQDRLLTLVALVGISTPSFWLGLLLILLFSVGLQWLPVSGMYAVYGGGDLWDLLRHLLLPAISLALVASGIIARYTRSAMLEVLQQGYIRAARARGLAENKIVYRHAFKNTLVEVVPVIGLQTGFLFGGAVYIETVFQWPGLGRMLVEAIASRDLLLVQGGVLVMASVYVLVNLFTDIIQHLLDPRIGLR